jgi:hypothetical protein
MTNLNCSQISDSSGICTQMESLAYGGGILMQTLQPVLFPFLIGLATVAVAIGLFTAIIFVIKNSVTKISIHK